jgi:hypothetical protein
MVHELSLQAEGEALTQVRCVSGNADATMARQKFRREATYCTRNGYHRSRQGDRDTNENGGDHMATRKRKYSRGAGSDVKSEMHRYKRGTAKSGPGGKGGRVKSRKQAIAIGLSKARKEGKRVPKKKTA